MDTLYSAGLLDTPLGFVLSLALGFGLGLVISRCGLADPWRVAGFFRLRDMNLAKVLITAGLTAGLGLGAAQSLGLVSLEELGVQPTYILAQGLGGLLFGAGLALGGWFPASALAGLGAGRLSALAYLGAALVAMLVFGLVQGFLGPILGLGTRGLSTLFYALGKGPVILIPSLTLAGLALLWLCEVKDRGWLLVKPGTSRAWLAGLSLVVLALALAVVRLPQISLPPQPVAKASPAHDQVEIYQTKDMATRELAARLTAGDTSLTVVDLRPPEEYAAFHLKNAINTQAEDLPKTLAWRKNSGAIVLYAEDEMSASRAAMALTDRGYGNVSVLAGGLAGFFLDCLQPASLRSGPLTARETDDIDAWRDHFLPEKMSHPQAPAWALNLPDGLNPPGLVEPAWLAANLDKPGIKIIDLRPAPQYNSGHIPGSFSLQPENLRGNLGGLPSMLLPGAMLAEVFGQMGLGPRDLVVLAPGDFIPDATLAAMALERLGHKRYLILNGGLKAWQDQGLPKSTLLPQAQALTYPPPLGPDTFTVDGPQTLLATGDGRTTLIDARPADYYQGAKSDEARAGHIPTAVNRPFTEDQTKGPGGAMVLKPVDELAQAYAQLIKTKDQPVIVYCRTGHLASQAWWVLTRLLGYTNVRYYDGSWSEWSARPQWPIAVGPPAKEDKP